MSTTTLRALGALLLVPALLTGQRPTLSAAVKQYVAVDTLVVALTHVRVIDGTGARALTIRTGSLWSRCSLDTRPAPRCNRPDRWDCRDLSRMARRG